MSGFLFPITDGYMFTDEYVRVGKLKIKYTGYPYPDYNSNSSSNFGNLLFSNVDNGLYYAQFVDIYGRKVFQELDIVKNVRNGIIDSVSIDGLISKFIEVINREVKGADEFTYRNKKYSVYKHRKIRIIKYTEKFYIDDIRDQLDDDDAPDYLSGTLLPICIDYDIDGKFMTSFIYYMDTTMKLGKIVDQYKDMSILNSFADLVSDIVDGNTEDRYNIYNIQYALKCSEVRSMPNLVESVVTCLETIWDSFIGTEFNDSLSDTVFGRVINDIGSMFNSIWNKFRSTSGIDYFYNISDILKNLDGFKYSKFILIELLAFYTLGEKSYLDRFDKNASLYKEMFEVVNILSEGVFKNYHCIGQDVLAVNGSRSDDFKYLYLQIDNADLLRSLITVEQGSTEYDTFEIYNLLFKGDRIFAVQRKLLSYTPDDEHFFLNSLSEGKREAILRFSLDGILKCSSIELLDAVKKAYLSLYLVRELSTITYGNTVSSWLNPDGFGIDKYLATEDKKSEGYLELLKRLTPDIQSRVIFSDEDVFNHAFVKKYFNVDRELQSTVDFIDSTTDVFLFFNSLVSTTADMQISAVHPRTFISTIVYSLLASNQSFDFCKDLLFKIATNVDKYRPLLLAKFAFELGKVCNYASNKIPHITKLNLDDVVIDVRMKGSNIADIVITLQVNSNM